MTITVTREHLAGLELALKLIGPHSQWCAKELCNLIAQAQAAPVAEHECKNCHGIQPESCGFNAKAPVAEPAVRLEIGQTYTSTVGFGPMTFIGETHDIDGWLPTFRARDGRKKAYSHDRIPEVFAEFQRPSSPVTEKPTSTTEKPCTRS
jgi:hypothetical protein